MDPSRLRSDKLNMTIFGLAVFGSILLTACNVVVPPTPFPTLPAQHTAIALAAQATQPPPQTAVPTISPTLDPFRGLTISDLRTRSYGAGKIDFEAEQRISSSFSRYLFSYPSDGLNVHGFLNLPRGEGLFPVVFVLHGYIEPDEYETLTYTTRYADALAAEGFIVLHPNYRNYPPSDRGPNSFRVGYAVDVLNLIALVENQAGQPGPLERADPEAIGLFGHSMGGGISLRVLAARAPVQAAVLYGSMNADEQLNFEKIFEWSDGERGLFELNTPAQALASISPFYHLDGIQAALSIHHGEDDELVPPAWSDDLCQRMMALGKTVECYSYPGEPHTFIGFGGIQLIERSVAFYREYLGAP